MNFYANNKADNSFLRLWIHNLLSEKELVEFRNSEFYKNLVKTHKA